MDCCLRSDGGGYNRRATRKERTLRRNKARSAVLIFARVPEMKGMRLWAQIHFRNSKAGACFLHFVGFLPTDF